MRVVGLGADADPPARGRHRARRCGCSTRARSARGLRVDGGAAAPALQIDDGAVVESSVVLGRVRVRGGAAGLSSVLVDARVAGGRG